MSKYDMINNMIKELVEKKEWAKVRELVLEMPAPDIADYLINYNKPERVLFFRLLSRSLMAEVFSYLDYSQKDDLLRELTDDETGRLLDALTPDDRTHFFEDLPGEATQRLLNLLDYETRGETLRLLGYPAQSVGRLMTPDYVAVRQEWTIDLALEHIRKRGKDSEIIDVIYVVESNWKLLDAVSLRKFVLARHSDRVNQVMDYSFISISALEDREKAVQMIQHYDLNALPVVDSEGVLLGIVTVDDVMDVAQEEATEDFQRIAAVVPFKRGYRHANIWSMFKNRIVWLAVLILVNLAATEIMAFHEELLLSSIALVFFIPLLIAAGGNAGAQSATLIVRAIATDDLKMDQWLWAVGRELVVGLLLGIALGLIASMLGLYRGGLQIALVVSVSMASIVVVSNLIGTGLPFLLSKMRLDSAVASSPLITSVADVIGLIIYFFIARLVLGGIG